MGSAIAYFLAADPAFAGSVVVIERDPTYRIASSALSASSIRQQFSTPENIRMSQFGFAFLRDAGELLAVDGPGEPPPDIGLVERGYLYLAPPGGRGHDARGPRRPARGGRRRRPADAGRADGAISRGCPWRASRSARSGLAAEGWFDGYGLTCGRSAARRSRWASTYVAGEVVGLRRATAPASTTVELADGTTIACGTVVDAAGPWAADVAAMAGVSLPVEARRRCVFAFEAADPPRGPAARDRYVRRLVPARGRGVHRGDPARRRGRPSPTSRSTSITRSGRSALWPALASRVPAFDALRRTGGWAGYYEMNTFDHNAILGRHPEVANLLFANGFSGHGIQQAPAVGPGDRRAHRAWPLRQPGPVGVRRRADRGWPSRRGAQRHRVSRTVTLDGARRR